MQHGERERSLQVEVARLRKALEDTENARVLLLGDERREKRRADAAESALAAARREIAELRDDLGASHSRGAHLHCSKDRCDVAADAMEALTAPAAAAGEEGKR